MAEKRTQQKVAAVANKLKRDDPKQSRLFVKAAKEHEVDDEQSQADDIVGYLSSKPPTPHKG